jgi:DNA-directed RNA polymerase specialized sigma24 family protein
MQLTRRRRSQAALAFRRTTRPLGPTTGSVAFAAWVEQQTAREAALALGCTEGSVRNWATARTQPSIGAAKRIEELAGVPIVAWTEATS